MGLAESVGLLGGSFDPIHNGHLQLARDALKHLPLAEIRFIPAAQPWQKGELTATEHRAMMVQIAIADEPRFVLDMREVARGGPTYTIDTLREIRRAEPHRPLMLIIGSDQFARIETWRDWREIVQIAQIAVAQRAGVPLKTANVAATKFRMTPVDVSATEVRCLLAEPLTRNEQRVAAMVPTRVLDYIRQHNLYRTD